jgi:hypothetical protein
VGAVDLLGSALFFVRVTAAEVLLEFSLDPPQATRATAAKASSANFLERVMIEFIFRQYNSSRREILHLSLLHARITESLHAQLQHARTIFVM